MSGIAGLLNLDGAEADGEILRRMAKALVHRGPHAQRLFLTGPFGVAHMDLRTTPQSDHDDAPLLNSQRTSCIALDGRLDNREELCSRLLNSCSAVNEIGDARLILLAYQQWKESCLERILGDFAFVVWDDTKKKLFCARDPMGVKPLFYAQSGRTLVFASEPRALFQHPSFSPSPNLPLIAEYLAFWFAEREQTLYERVRRLPGGWYATVADGNLCLKKYWNVDTGATVRFRDDREYAAHFHDVFREAVRCRLRARTPVAIALSGGLDSSSIASVAADLTATGGAKGEVEAFSVVYDSLSCDERPFIQEVVQHWKLPWMSHTHESSFEDLDVRKASDYPDILYGINMIPFAPCFRDLNRRGVTVIMDGAGGDELFATGFAHLTDMATSFKWASLMRQLRADAATTTTPWTALLLNYCMRPLVPGLVKTVVRRVLPAAPRVDAFGILQPQYAAMVAALPQQPPRELGTTFPTRAQQAIWDGLIYGWNATIAFDLMERFTARFSLELRRPFLDVRLVRLALALPQGQRLRRFRTKHVLRNAMQGLLPSVVGSRLSKAEFSEPKAAELQVRQTKRISTCFRNPRLAELGVVEGPELMALYEAYLRGRTELQNFIEVALQLELWTRQLR